MTLRDELETLPTKELHDRALAVAKRRVDVGFLGAHTIGWDELEPLLVVCTPEWGEDATGVPAHLIEEAAELYGQGPSLLWLGQGLQRQRTGGNVIRACALLPAVTGNLSKPGAGLRPPPSPRRRSRNLRRR